MIIVKSMFRKSYATDLSDSRRNAARTRMGITKTFATKTLPIEGRNQTLISEK